MYNLTSTFHPFTIEGYSSAQVPLYIFEAIRQEILEISNDQAKAIPYNSYLAGDLDYEFSLKKCVPTLEPFLNVMAKEYWRFLNQPKMESKNYKVGVDENRIGAEFDVWVNFQSKAEYNPIHSHSGVLSFVIYVQVPFLFADEIKNVKSNNKTRSCFTFILPKASEYLPQLGNYSSVTTINLPVDSTWVGKIILFKSDQPHMVEPFYTSDDYRISVAGNLVIDE